MSRNGRRSHLFSTVRALFPFSHILFCSHLLASAFLRELSVVEEVCLLLEGFAAFVATERLLKFGHFVHSIPANDEATFPTILANKSFPDLHFRVSF